MNARRDSGVTTVKAVRCGCQTVPDPQFELGWREICARLNRDQLMDDNVSPFSVGFGHIMMRCVSPD